MSILVTLSTFKDSLSSEYISTLVLSSRGTKSFQFWFGFIHFTETEPCFSKVTFSILAFFQSVNHVLKAHQTILLCPQAYYPTNFFEIALKILPANDLRGYFLILQISKTNMYIIVLKSQNLAHII